MITTCAKCGVQLSLPYGVCQQCGTPIDGIDKAPTVIPPIAPAPVTPTLAAPPPEAIQPHHCTTVHPGTQPPAIQIDLNEDEAGKVEKLLGMIAKQSHYEERYELRGTIARGGMGQVTRAYDRILRREVAIKMMFEGTGTLSQTPAIRGQFLKEARVGGRLLHPNILSVFDVGVNRAGQIYYTMRLVDGASLQHCLDSLENVVNTKLISYPLRKIIEALVGACQGVDFAHQNGVIHLDLKPQNILVSGFHEVFVIDWGLARVDEIDDTDSLIDLYRDRTNSTTTTSCTAACGTRIVGTPGYMSPEQALGNFAEFSPSADVYGLGGVLYYILYGCAPNQGRNITEIIASTLKPLIRGKLRSGVLPRGQRVRKDAQQSIEALEAICVKALETEAVKRHANVEALIVDLNDWLASTPFQ